MMASKSADFIGQVYGWGAKLWPTTANLTGLCQKFHRRSEGLVGECVTLAKKNGQDFGKVYRFLGPEALNRDSAGAPDPPRT